MSWSVWQVGNDPFVMLVALLLIPITCYWLARAGFAWRLNRWLAISAACLYTIFVSYFFPWSLFSVYLRWIGIIGWAAAAFFALRRPLRQPPASRKIARRRRNWLVASLALTLVLDGSIVKGMIPWTGPVKLAFPLKDGMYSVSQGGGSFWINYHYGEDAGFRYSIDIVKVDALGTRADGLLPEKMESYRIYRETVYSPCGGKVVKVRDGLADSPLFTSPVDAPGGNRIAIDCSGVLVNLEHLLNGSIAVTPGQLVAAGDALARVGSSGLSSEPHLHIQANAYTGGVIGRCLPMTFAGRYLVRNALIKSVETDIIK